jgi:hypothetical protein
LPLRFSLPNSCSSGWENALYKSEYHLRKHYLLVGIDMVY